MAPIVEVIGAAGIGSEEDLSASRIRPSLLCGHPLNDLRKGLRELWVPDARFVDNLKEVRLAPVVQNITDKKIKESLACHQCFGHEKGCGLRDGLCYAHENDLQSIASLLMDSDGIIMGSPVYVLGIPSKLRAIMERTSEFTANSMNEASGRLQYKTLGAVVVAAGRRAGQDQAATEIY